MAWQTPKTNWTSADGVSDADMNRIEGNIALLRQAANIQIADAGNVIAATNVEDALQELYGNTVTGKGKIASALAVMNQTASSSDTYDTLANKIKAISTDANAAVGDVLSGKTFYQGGVKRTGTMPNRGAPTFTPGTSNQSIAAGYYSGGTVLGDPDLVADNIRNGVNIFGVVGNCKRYFQAAGNITLSNAASQSISVTSCTFRPTFVLLICDDYKERKFIAFRGTVGSWTADSMWATWRKTVTGSYSGFGSANITFTSNGFTAVSPNETLYYSTENLAWLAIRTE